MDAFSLRFNTLSYHLLISSYRVDYEPQYIKKHQFSQINYKNQI